MPGFYWINTHKFYEDHSEFRFFPNIEIHYYPADKNEDGIDLYNIELAWLNYAVGFAFQIE